MLLINIITLVIRREERLFLVQSNEQYLESRQGFSQVVMATEIRRKSLEKNINTFRKRSYKNMDTTRQLESRFKRSCSIGRGGNNSSYDVPKLL